jgi:hypothetical protein
VEEKTEFDRIGVNTLRIYQKNGRWVFDKNGAAYDMAPAGFTEMSLDPLVIGADRLLATGCRMKGMATPERGFLLLFSESYFPMSDVKFVYREPKFDGWVYDVEEMNLTGLMPGQAAWMCPYMKFFYETPPRILFIKLEECQ